MKVDIFHGSQEENRIYRAYPGLYKIECWGGQGITWDDETEKGRGGYVSGLIRFHQFTLLYLHIGGVGIEGSKGVAYNGGGWAQRGGGGATDVRLKSGAWNNFESLKSRIIVAGGGGGGDSDGNTRDYGGAAGGLEGFDSDLNSGKGGKQNRGGDGNPKGTFGKGGGIYINDEDGNGGGGGGYFGGGASQYSTYYSGGGGSSFISGHPGCLAIDELSTNESDMIMLSNSIHYSGYSFFETQIIDGKSEMPSPNGGKEIGHPSHGAIRITFYFPISCKTNSKPVITIPFVLIFFYFIVSC